MCAYATSLASSISSANACRTGHERTNATGPAHPVPTAPTLMSENPFERAARSRYSPSTWIFSKPPTTLVGHEEDIRWDSAFTQRLDYEVEFALVIGKAGRRISAQRATEHIY